MKHIYGKRNYIQYSGEELSRKNVIGPPDYYIRNGNALFLFENKDVFINADVKQSYNFRLLEEELKRKFYFEEKQEKKNAKAILQLRNNIEKILSYQNEFDKEYSAENLRIYPILVLHDSSFNAPGLNYVITHWYNIELGKLKDKGLNISQVRPITIINIDCLILYADFLNTKKATLDHLIDKYILFCQFNEKKQYRDLEEFKAVYGETLLSFSYFIDHYNDVGFKKVPARLRNKIMESIVSN